MAGGAIASGAPDARTELYTGKCTLYVVVVAIVAASGGLLFG
jgi:hypothetical protein